MPTMFAVAALLVQLLATIAAAFNLEITSPPFYEETYLSSEYGHVGAGINLMLISAAPDPSFVFTPSANDPSVGELSYPIVPGYNGAYGIGYSTYDDTTLGWFATLEGAAVQFAFGPDGDMTVAGGSGWIMACNTTANDYPTYFAINYFNGTGTPDYTQCLNVSISRV